MPWLELLVPFLVVLAATSCLTVAVTFVQRGGEAWERSLLEFIAASAGVAALTAVGIFLRISGLIEPGLLNLVIGNLAFVMLSLTSWAAVRTAFFVTQARPGAALGFGFWGLTILGYGGVQLVGLHAGGKLDFPYVGETYAAMSLYLAAGLGFALAVVWRRRARLSVENRATLGRFTRVFVPLGTLFLVDELARTAAPLPWTPLLPLAPLTLYGFVIVEIALRLRRTVHGGADLRLVADEIASRCFASPLTKREREVLLCLLRGMSNTAIGDELRVSQSTVKNHVYSIFQKVGVGSRGELALLADRTRLAE